MRPQTSPLLGYNTNIRHKGKLYHIQTEDSGVNRPHIITHLFADGGRIVASAKTEYAQHLGSETLPQLVKAKMQEQHKAMLIALRDGRYDSEDAPAVPAAARPIPAPAKLDVEALERAVRAKLATSPALGQKVRPPKRAAEPPRTPADARPAARKEPPRAAPKSGNAKTLDDVIRSYLDEEVER